MSVLRRHVETHAPPQTRLTFTPLPFRANPYIMPRDTVANRAAAKVMSFLVISAFILSMNCLAQTLSQLRRWFIGKMESCCRCCKRCLGVRWSFIEKDGQSHSLICLPTTWGSSLCRLALAYQPTTSTLQMRGENSHQTDAILSCCARCWEGCLMVSSFIEMEAAFQPWRSSRST